jgi:hypothetical protein
LLFLLILFNGHALGQERIRVGLGSISLQSGLVHIAKDRGLFAKYGLVTESVYIPGGSTNVQVLVSGSLDLSQLSGAPGVAANLEGADLVYFLGLLDKLNYQLIARPEIKSVEQLKGKKFAVSRFGSSADFGMRALLKRVGVDPVKEATILQIGDEPSRIAAVTSGNVDGTVVNAPFGSEAERLKLNVLADAVKMNIPFLLPDAVPLICEPGDVTMCNRQAVHGSFANTSPDVRVTINFGFHRRRSVLNVTSGGVHNPVTTYDAEYVRARSRLIAYAIDARRQRFPEETSYRYQPLAPEASRYRWTPEARADIRDNNLMDLGI